MGSDGRCLTLPQHLELINMMGLTDSISCALVDIDIERVIQPYFRGSYLLVLRAGSTPTHPLRILAHNMMLRPILGVVANRYAQVHLSLYL